MDCLLDKAGGKAVEWRQSAMRSLPDIGQRSKVAF
jgi:hypothetical protein